jgi:hypothetical protein
MSHLENFSIPALRPVHLGLVHALLTNKGATQVQGLKLGNYDVTSALGSKW